MYNNDRDYDLPAWLWWVLGAMLAVLVAMSTAEAVSPFDKVYLPEIGDSVMAKDSADWTPSTAYRWAYWIGKMDTDTTIVRKAHAHVDSTFSFYDTYLWIPSIETLLLLQQWTWHDSTWIAYWEAEWHE